MKFILEYGIQADKGGAPVWLTAHKDPFYESLQFEVPLLAPRMPPRTPIECAIIARNYVDILMKRKAAESRQFTFLYNSSHVAHKLLDLDWKEHRTLDGLVGYQKKIKTANKRWYVQLKWEGPHAI